QLSTRFVGEALLAAGDLTTAERLTALLVERTGGRFRQALVLVSRGDVLSRLGRAEEAHRCYAEAIALAETIGSRSALAVGGLAGAGGGGRLAGAPARGTRARGCAGRRAGPAPLPAAARAPAWRRWHRRSGIVRRVDRTRGAADNEAVSERGFILTPTYRIQ